METTPRVLIIEDDQSIRATIKLVLEREGFDSIEAASGQEALQMIALNEPTLVLLDLMLPDMNGLDVCQAIRQRGVALPVIVLSGKTDEIDKVVLLELGADDYVTKPFSPRELVARMRAVLRRAQRPEPTVTSSPTATHNSLRFGNVVIKQAEREVTVSGKLVQLTPTEFDLIAFFANNPGVALSRDQLISHIWGYDSEGETRLLDSHVAHLRAKLETDPANPRLITTVRNIGYKLNPTLPSE